MIRTMTSGRGRSGTRDRNFSHQVGGGVAHGSTISGCWAWIANKASLAASISVATGPNATSLASLGSDTQAASRAEEGIDRGIELIGGEGGGGPLADRLQGALDTDQIIPRLGVLRSRSTGVTVDDRLVSRV